MKKLLFKIIFLLSFFSGSFSYAEINIDATDGLGNTALLNACEKGLIEIVNYLIDNGANINHQK